MKKTCDGCGKNYLEVGVIKRYKGAYYKGAYIGHMKFYTCQHCQRNVRIRHTTVYWRCDGCDNRFVFHDTRRPVHCLICGGGYFTPITREEYEEFLGEA